MSLGPTHAGAVGEPDALALIEVVGGSHVMTHANPAFCRLLGVRREDVLGRPLADVLPRGPIGTALLERLTRSQADLDQAGGGAAEVEPTVWLAASWPALERGEPAVGVVIGLARVAGAHRDVVAVNQALVLTGLRLHEATDAAERANERLEREIAARTEVEAALGATRRQLEVEAQALAHVHESSARLWHARDLAASIDGMLDAAMTLVGADLGCVQLLISPSRGLELLLHRGFSPDLAARFAAVAADDASAIGQTLRTRQQTLVDDVMVDPGYAADRALATAAGYRSVQATPLLGVDGAVLGVVSTHHRAPGRPSALHLRLLDLYVRQVAAVIESMLARAALVDSEARVRFMAESMPQKIFTATAAGEIDYFNRQWLEFTGLPFEQLRGWGWAEVIHPDDVADNVQRWRHALATGEPFLLEHRFRRADGAYRWHLTRAAAMRSDDGAIRMWIGSNTEIHDQKLMMEQLGAAVRDKDAFLAMLAHELRNPLAPIQSAAHVLRLLDSDDPRLVRAQAIIERQADHLARLVDDLLDVSRLQKGKIRLVREVMDLTVAIRHALESCEHLITAQRHTVTVDLPAAPLLIDADPVRVDQCLVNLIANAAKYTAPGGAIHVAAGRDGGDAVFRIKDNGIGIEAGMLLRIFEIFAQATQALARSQGGLGLGLTLVHELVESHGGSVLASSPGLGKGSEFIVRLPAVDAAVLPVAAAVPAVPDPARSRHVLVVDDSADNRESMEMFLARLGHIVELAEDGEQAVAQALAGRPEVAFVDIGLPGLDGYEVARAIRQQPDGAQTVLIAVSGYGQPEDKRRALEAGFDLHLTKPVPPARLREVLRDLDQLRAARGA